MVAKLLLRGMLAGALAGLLAFGFARTFGEPLVDKAIAFEEEMAKAKGEAHEDELVSRPTQAGIGLFTGVMVFSAAMGGLFSLAFSYGYGRIGAFGPRATAALLAAAAFLSLVAIPTLKYPANPPSVGDPDTIAFRTEMYFLLILISLAATGLAVTLASTLRSKLGAWNSTIAAVCAFVAIVASAFYILPDINEVPETFSAVTLWQFRMTSVGIQAILWTTLGLLFGAWAESTLSARRA